MSENVDATNTIVLQREQFTKFLGVVKLLENSCTDCHIINGYIRQLVNNRQAIIELNLSNLIGDHDITISNIKQKVQILKTFELDDNVTIEDKNIVIQIGETDYQFIDPLSKMKFRKVADKFLDNKFIPSSEFAKKITCAEENLIFSYDISAYMSKRIKSICEGFNNETIRCDLDGLTARLSTSTSNSENLSVLVDKIELNKELGHKFFKVLHLPFALDNSSEIIFNLYEFQSDVLMCKFDQKYYGIPITIYTQVRLIAE